MADKKPRSERFGWSRSEVVISQCIDCEHKHDGASTCDAFTEAIPMDILTNVHDHRDPHAGDQGIRFEPI